MRAYEIIADGDQGRCLAEVRAHDERDALRRARLSKRVKIAWIDYRPDRPAVIHIAPKD